LGNPTTPKSARKVIPFNPEHIPGNTIPYSPPEVCSGKAASFTSKSDVFSLGILIFEILYEKRPYFIPKKGEHPSVSMRDYLSKWFFNS
jgi:serine/threonine protein kinase